MEFVGHPLLDRPQPSAGREQLRSRFEIRSGETAIGLLPGSRTKEVERILPAMAASAALIKQKIPSAVFFLVQSPNVPKEIYEKILQAQPSVSVRKLENQAGLFRDAVTAMDFALIASGTATLEAALLGTPFFLLYKASWTTYIIGRKLVRVPFLGLVNLLAGKQVVPEFIQNLNPASIAHQAAAFLQNPKAAKEMKKEFEAVKRQLGGPGASGKAAQEILKNH